MKNCKNCRFAEKHKKSELSRCRFNPPTLIVSPVVNEITGKMRPEMVGMFPQCPDDDLGCGRFAEREEPA